MAWRYGWTRFPRETGGKDTMTNSNRAHPLRPTATRALDRFYGATIAAADLIMAITAAAMICLFFYSRQPISLFREVLLFESAMLVAQLLWNKRLRLRGIAIQTFLLNLYVLAAVLMVLERHEWRKSTLDVFFAFMSIRWLAKILYKLRRAGGPVINRKVARSSESQ
jgi:hypothetical protein